jgi:hypothetical protein
MIAKCDLVDEKELKSYIAPAASSMQSRVRHGAAPDFNCFRASQRHMKAPISQLPSSSLGAANFCAATAEFFSTATDFCSLNIPSFISSSAGNY